MKSLKITTLAITIFSLLILWSCENEQDPPDCSTSNLAVTASSVSDATGCTTSDGSVTLTASGGVAPYQFKVNSGNLQSSETFTGLAPGTYTATVVDANNCESTFDFQIAQGTSSLAFTSTTSSNSGCGTNNSTVTVDATGDGTVQYKLDDGAFQSSNTFSDVSAGAHVITITDDSGCTTTAEIKVLTGVSYDNDIHTILMTNCAISGCHDGSNGSSRDWTVFSNVQTKAGNIKSRTSSGSMPPASSGKQLSQQQIDLIACWVDDGALDN